MSASCPTARFARRAARRARDAALQTTRLARHAVLLARGAAPIAFALLGVGIAGPVASESAACRIEPFTGATRPEGALAHMRVARDAGPCAIVNYGLPRERDHPAESGRIVKVPAHGTAVFEAPQALYTPMPGYVGRDAFEYEAVARGQHDQPVRLKVHVQVTVGR